MPDLHAVVKAYDIRGIVPDQLDDRVAYALGAATVDVLAVDADRDRTRHAGFRSRA